MSDKLPIADYWAIREHNRLLMESAQKSADNIRPMSKDVSNLWAVNQVRYWENVISALKWSTQIARQKAGVPANEPTTSI